MSATPQPPDSLVEATWSLAATTSHAPADPATTQSYLTALRRLAADARSTADPPVQEATDALLAQIPARLTGPPTSALERVLDRALHAPDESRHAAVSVVAGLTARLVQDHPRVDIQRLSAPLTVLARATTPHRDPTPARGILALNTVLTAAATTERRRGNTAAATDLTSAATQTRHALREPRDWTPLTSEDFDALEDLHWRVSQHIADLRALHTNPAAPTPWLPSLVAAAAHTAETLQARTDLPGIAPAATALRQIEPEAVTAAAAAAAEDPTVRDTPRPPDPRISGPHR